MCRARIFLLSFLLIMNSDGLEAGDLYVAMPGQAAWSAGHRHGATIRPSGEVQFAPTGGDLTTPVLGAAGLFDRAVPHWTAETPEGSEIDVEARIFRGDVAVSDWMKCATWSRLSLEQACGTPAGWSPPAPDPTPEASKEEKPATWLDQDTIGIREGADGIQLRVRVRGKPGSEPVRLFRLAAALRRMKHGGVADLAGTERRKRPGTRLEVPYRSQGWENERIRSRVCGPTSLSMILGYHRLDRPTVAIARLAYDRPNDIFGNWAYLAAVAGELGFRGEVRYWKDDSPDGGFRRIEEEVRAGRPLILSISFKAGELTGSPVEQTAGHLIVVTGFDEKGDVRVNDPAAKTEEEGRRVYDRAELLKAWKSGVVIRVLPR